MTWASTVRRWEQPHPFPGVRALRTTLRTAHLVASGILYGGHVYNVPPEHLWPALLATVASGGTLMAIEVYRLPLWLVQLRGVAALVKILLVAMVPFCWSFRVWLLTATVVIGSVASHMPGRYRYYSIVHGRPVGAQETG